MKLVVAMVQDKDAARLLEALVKQGWRATKLASTGGFLREGNTTLLVGVESEDVEKVLETVRSSCRSRRQLVTPVVGPGSPGETCVHFPVEVLVGGATVFVLDVERFERV